MSSLDNVMFMVSTSVQLARTVREALFLWQWNLQHFRAVSRGDFDYLLIDFHQGPSAPLLESFKFFNFRPLTWKKTSQTISKTVILKRICPPPNKFIHHQAPNVEILQTLIEKSIFKKSFIDSIRNWANIFELLKEYCEPLNILNLF